MVIPWWYLVVAVAAKRISLHDGGGRVNILACILDNDWVFDCRCWSDTEDRGSNTEEALRGDMAEVDRVLLWKSSWIVETWMHF